MARFTAEMDDHVYLQRVRSTCRAATDSGVRGTRRFRQRQDRGRLVRFTGPLKQSEARLRPAPGN